jgi:hypothetical protein
LPLVGEVKVNVGDEMCSLFGAIHDQLHLAQGDPCDPDGPAVGQSSSGWPPQLWCHCPLD